LEDIDKIACTGWPNEG